MSCWWCYLCIQHHHHLHQLRLIFIIFIIFIHTAEAEPAAHRTLDSSDIRCVLLIRVLMRVKRARYPQMSTNTEEGIIWDSKWSRCWRFTIINVYRHISLHIMMRFHGIQSRSAIRLRCKDGRKMSVRPGSGSHQNRRRSGSTITSSWAVNAVLLSLVPLTHIHHHLHHLHLLLLLLIWVCGSAAGTRGTRARARERRACARQDGFNRVNQQICASGKHTFIN